jgi:Cys-tRNA(Pro)/Cys-tRNA(Cys) deacylase
MASLGEQELKRLGVPFTSHEYDYRIKGAEAASGALGIPLSAALKTLVIRLADERYVFLCVPGGSAVSMRNLARALHVKGAELASERDAERLTGYRVGGIGPFGSRTPLPLYLDLGALDHAQVYINGGRRGLLLRLDPEQLVESGRAELIDVGREG